MSPPFFVAIGAPARGFLWANMRLFVNWEHFGDFSGPSAASVGQYEIHEDLGVI